MSSTKSTVTRIASGTPRPSQFPRGLNRPMSAADFLSPPSMNRANHGILDRFNERYQSGGFDISPEGFSELRIFYEFLAHHVQPSRICDVQCMRLWSEWVRTFQRRTNDFPKQVLEKEFRSAIRDIFEVTPARDGSRGPVYPGLRFVP